MTRFAGTDNFSMIHCTVRDRCPRATCMAGFATITGINMRRVFSTGFRAIVTSVTGITRRTVIKNWNQPISGGMADVALGRGRNMINIFSAGNNTIVTTTAGAKHLRMID